MGIYGYYDDKRDKIKISRKRSKNVDNKKFSIYRSRKFTCQRSWQAHHFELPCGSFRHKIELFALPRRILYFPIPQERIDFIPGQFLQFIFDEDNKNNRELNKYLSFSSSPTNDYIEVTKRLSASQFSQRLNSLKPNDTVTVKASMGTCVFGKITNELIANKEYDMTQRKIFIFGPPKMVNTMKNLCIEIGCKKENLRTESFIGY